MIAVGVVDLRGCDEPSQPVHTGDSLFVCCLRRFAGQGILFASRHNVCVTGYPRVENWEQVRDVFLAGKTPILPVAAARPEATQSRHRSSGV